MSSFVTAGSVPLCVDLDGTLVRTDTLWESLALLVKNRPWLLLAVPFWLLGGKARFKREVSRRVTLDPAALPYRTELLERLHAERAAGRSIVLVTAADESIARAVADHLGLFSEVLATNPQLNLKGRNKAGVLIARFGPRGFDYAGDHVADLEVWQNARQAWVVGANSLVAAAAARVAEVGWVAPQAQRGTLASLLKLLRPHQWVKNFIVFIPVVTSHQITRPAVLGAAALGAVAFSLCASAIYVFNDLMDLAADRRHPSKRRRPLASGELGLPWAFLLPPVLLGMAMSIGGLLPGGFTLVLAIYFATSTAYSLHLKRTPLLDVFVLSSLYTLRLLAGHAATGIVTSDWLLAFSIFLFLSLALVKRFQELQTLPPDSQGQIRGRGYEAVDLPLLMPLGVASGYLAGLVLALYVSSEQVKALYHRPSLLLLVCLLLLYWVSRVWLIAHRGKMHDDPIVFALKDAPSYAVAAGALVIVWFST